MWHVAVRCQKGTEKYSVSTGVSKHMVSVRLSHCEENGRDVRKEGEFPVETITLYMNIWGDGRSTVDDKFQMLQYLMYMYM